MLLIFVVDTDDGGDYDDDDDDGDDGDDDDDDGLPEQTVMLWSLPDGAAVGVLSGHEHVVECVAFSSSFQDAEASKRLRKAALTVRCCECRIDSSIVRARRPLWL